MLIRREIRDVARAMAGPRLTVIVPRARLTRPIGGSVFAVDPGMQKRYVAAGSPSVADLLRWTEDRFRTTRVATP